MSLLKRLLSHKLKSLRNIKCFSSALHEEGVGVVDFFGAERLVGDNLLRAEVLVNKWRSLFHPAVACGSRGYALIGSLADLENALLDYATEHLYKTGLFSPMYVDDILPLSTTRSCGVNVEDDNNERHTIQYVLTNNNSNDDTQKCLSGTAEMGIAHNLRCSIFNAHELPKFYMARSRCFRPEVSNSAQETGIYRVHEFNKVEMFAVCLPEQSGKVLSQIVEIQREIFSGLNIHCRLRDMPSEDLSVAAQRKFDIEAWMPGRGIWGEVSSASNCTDYQARRLSICYRATDAKDNSNLQFVHTCNGTAIASSRALIALLESHQQEGKKLLPIPDAIRSYLPRDRSPILRLQNASAFEYKF